MVTAYTDGQVTLRSRRAKVGYHEAADFTKHQGVERGDLVVHGLDILRGSVGVSDSAGAISAVCTVGKVAGADARFIAYAIRAQAMQGFTKALARGVREGGADFRRWDTLAELPIPCPAVEEQRRIADFLDDQVSRLRVAATQAQAAASLAAEGIARRRRMRLTNGDRFPPESSTYPMVPARYLCKVATGSGDTQDAVEGGDVPFYVRSDNPLSAQSATFNTEAILTSGDGAGVGKVFHHVKGRFHAHQRVYVLHTFQGIHPRYFFHYFSTFFKDVALDGSAKSTVDSVRRDMITNMPIVLPPREVQELLVNELDHLQSIARQVAATAERLTALVEERTCALITACVTGEFDVSSASNRAADAALGQLPPTEGLLAE